LRALGFEGQTVNTRRKIFRFPKNKAHPDQASFSHRFLAFAFDALLIFLVALVLYVAFTEVAAPYTHEEGWLTKYKRARKEDRSVMFFSGSGETLSERIKEEYLEVLEDHIPLDEYESARGMSREQLEARYEEVLIEFGSGLAVMQEEPEEMHILREFIIGYIYFVLFFRFGGRTLGKRVFRLKVIDLKKRKHLGWYQAFERTHGYACSALFVSLGFLQVLWDAKGLTMHDKIAGTTVIKLPRKKMRGTGEELGLEEEAKTSSAEVDRKDSYYAQKLSGERLKLCYSIAPPRVKQYLEAEIDFVLNKINAKDRVLELGCGYGRVLLLLAEKAELAVGIDTALDSLRLHGDLCQNVLRCSIFAMDAGRLGFKDGQFDKVVCVQNGISAFKREQKVLIAEALRVTRRGGSVLLSSYADRFWDDRLAWFRLQAEHGLIGAIDEENTGEGLIISNDGFKSDTVTSQNFRALASEFGLVPLVTEVDGSSLFCELRKV
jgi:2-polyprenyl-6-hydroxyphenyl methylase/3-demethylubiquinone-9 3-methyltransferase